MNTLPYEIQLLIFVNIKLITDKRQFLKTCTHYNTITKQSFENFEKDYETHNFDKIHEHCVEKFTQELCNDNYFNMIPKSYIKLSNKIIVTEMKSSNCIKLLDQMKNINCDFKLICWLVLLNIRFEVLKWANDNKFDWKTYINLNPINNIGTIKLISLNVYDWKLFVCAYCALTGHINTLKWAHENYFEWDGNTCAAAALGGYLNILKWLRGNGCEWNGNTCMATTFEVDENFKLLKWATENGCELNSNICAETIDIHLKILNWAEENGCPKI